MFRKILFFGIVFILTSCSSESSIKKNEQVFEYSYSNDEADLLKIINSYRESKGLSRLTIINHISYLCASHNKYMIQTKSLNHDSFVSRSNELISLFGATNVSENVANKYKSNIGVYSAWLASPNHKKNIEGDYTAFGLSIIKDDISGENYYTNIFIKLPN